MPLARTAIALLIAAAACAGAYATDMQPVVTGEAGVRAEIATDGQYLDVRVPDLLHGHGDRAPRRVLSVLATDEDGHTAFSADVRLHAGQVYRRIDISSVDMPQELAWTVSVGR